MRMQSGYQVPVQAPAAGSELGAGGVEHSTPGAFSIEFIQSAQCTAEIELLF